MFESSGGTLSFQVWVSVNPSDSTPRELLNNLSFWYSLPQRPSSTDGQGVDSTQYYHGNDWHGHLVVLGQLLQDDIPTLKSLGSNDAAVTVEMWWTGRPGSSLPLITQEELGLLCFPGVDIKINAHWDYGRHKCDLVLVSFCVYGPEPDHVSEILGEASKVIRVGDPIFSRGEIRNYRKQNAWILDTEGLCSSDDLFDHLDKLYQRLGPPKSEWNVFRKSKEASVQLRITVHAACGQTVPILSYDDLKKMGAYGAELVMESYDYEPIQNDGE